MGKKIAREKITTGQDKEFVKTFLKLTQEMINAKTDNAGVTIEHNGLKIRFKVRIAEIKEVK